MKSIVAFVAEDLIAYAAAADEEVVSETPADNITVRSAVDVVIAFAAIELVVTLLADNVVVAPRLLLRRHFPSRHR